MSRICGTVVRTLHLALRTISSPANVPRDETYPARCPCHGSPRTGGPRDKPQRINAPLLRRYTTLTLAEGALKAASVQPQTVPQSITKLRRQPWFHTVAPLPTGRPDAIPMLRPVSGMLAPGTCSWCATVSPRGTSPLFRPTHSRVAGASRCTIQLRPTRPAV
ncbi:uncharacterized protein PGTG_05663 [Puccinia graminis f. sp. tritici CRL 75-36-700-3]|uniref:Uncharacterized protein n=1 Tax=Puccinia graminis f. sp. tritici (strain CRL 75-36-700-3 / race SCCL) TaxID=418459 RepID=E3K527_PUCGT|nr:uncharacterized protein PGTG_05663 [Puccinia graminis f. sp. tritici CRL 75-36-700-3]EFP79342.1 hypothetical protein PGTG_05663 [Puccinia graminis f. sp. tritici CRL 75-36-700-3]